VLLKIIRIDVQRLTFVLYTYWTQACRRISLQWIERDVQGTADTISKLYAT